MTERVTRRDVPLGATAASMTPIPPINGEIDGIGTAAPIGNWGAASYGLPRPRLPRCMKALGDFKLFGETSVSRHGQTLIPEPVKALFQ
jgi:hypothetical protein